MPSHNDIAAFGRDGAVVLKGLFDAELLGLLAQGVRPAKMGTGTFCKSKTSQSPFSLLLRGGV